MDILIGVGVVVASGIVFVLGWKWATRASRIVNERNFVRRPADDDARELH